MRQNHDPLVPQRRNKKTGEAPDETEQRLNADLRALMNDKRYRDNDRDFRHYVQRQYRRVYDDPSSERPKHLTIGRPRTYVSDLEPFDRRREQLLRRAAETRESEGVKAKGAGTSLPGQLHEDGIARDAKIGRTLTGSADASFAKRPVDHELATDQSETEADEAEPLQERHIYPRGPNAGEAVQAYHDNKIIRHKKKIQRITAGVEGMIAAAEREGLVMAPLYMRRYLEGLGGIVHLDWSTMRAHGPAADAEMRIRDHYTNWFKLLQKDRTIGAPFMSLEDGDVLEIGKLQKGSTVLWDGDFYPDYSGEDRDSSLVFGAGSVVGYGDLRFERHGDEITVSGTVAFVVDEPYDFEEFGFKTYLISTFKSDGPTINNYDLKYLAEHGPAAEYRIQARHLAEISGTIVLVDGIPDPELSTFTWHDLDRHHS